MSRSYKFSNPNGLYFVSFAVVYWIDVFARKPDEYKNAVYIQLQGGENGSFQPHAGFRDFKNDKKQW